MSRLVINQAALAELLTGPTGPVYRATRAFADAVVADVKIHGPLGFDQGGSRAVGLLRADMSVRGPASVSLDGLAFTVGTDPVNPRDGYHYGEAIHEGRGPIDSAHPMIFQQRGSTLYRRTFHVGAAAGQPFLFDAVERVNAATPEVSFVIVRT